MTYTPQTEKYFKDFEKQVHKVYEVAEQARAKGFDPVDKVEIPLARTMAEKVVGLISAIYPQVIDSGIDKKILELEEQYGKLDPTVAFKIAEDVAKQKFCKFESLVQAIDAGIRIGFAYLTIGVVSPPIEGFTELKLEKTRDGKEYFKVYFSGPIRAAGTTASCMVLILIDYLRELFGYAKYDASEDEIKRYVTENLDYHERVTNLQYLPTEEEMEFLARHLPIQIAGEKTEKIEVSNYKNLYRVETNFIRGGMCLIFSEGLAQKAAKGFRLLNAVKKNGIKSTGFDFLEDYIKLHEQRDKGKTDDSPTYIKDLVAGRPVLAHPSHSGGLRFRYGRSRVSGFSASCLHPATMGITNNFMATGVQLKIEKPTKGTALTVCDSIEGPIVKLKNQSVKKITDLEEAKKIYKDVEEIIYLGDILFPFSDVVNRNSQLIKPAYVEEWWYLNLKEKNKEYAKKINYFDVGFEKAVEISKKFNLPLHPKYIFYWKEISNKQFLELINWLYFSWINEKIIFPYNESEREKYSEAKRALELLGVEHQVTLENVVVEKEQSKALFLNLGLDYNLIKTGKKLIKDFLDKEKFDLEGGVLEIVNKFSKFEIKDKSGEFIGARMGRPEKAKLRKLVGSPNILFPVGNEGGRLRSFQSALNIGKVRSSFPIYFCNKCDRETIYKKCEICGEKCDKLYYFRDTKEKSKVKIRDYDNLEGVPYRNKNIDIKDYFDKAVKNLGLKKTEIPELIKGVRGTSSEEHSIESLEKGILRAKYNLQVNKDGTIRLDATELPITHFKPKEIFVSIDKLKELGYEKDIYGNEVVDENQILELKPHDIILPCSDESPDEKADDVFIRICNFIDEELEKFYKLKPFYNVKKREDLIGKLGVCMAPHNCAGVVSRFIGFSKVQGLLASPYMHAAIRRDCDGDEAAIMLLGDVLINFSKKFLPGHRGGTQDAPLVLNAQINAGEVDDQILDFEYTPNGAYPLELYKLADQKKHSSEVKEIYTIRDALKDDKDPFVGLGFTHDTDDFNKGVNCSSYKLFGTMKEKVDAQMDLVEKLRSAETADTARLIIERHFIKDIRGNLRKFSMQGFRCVGCNYIMRRPPLAGVCPVCKGKIIFTIHEGGIKKYLDPAIELANKYDLSNYMKQNLELVKRYVESIFGKELEKQETLTSFLQSSSK